MAFSFSNYPQAVSIINDRHSQESGLDKDAVARHFQKPDDHFWKKVRAYFSMERPVSSIPQLDGLRAIAILLVLLRHGIRSRSWESHFIPVWPVPQWHYWDAAIPLLNGWMGVDLFFVLSGFLISSHLLKSLSSKSATPFKEFADKQSPPVKRMPLHWILTYALKRLLRIVPAYYAVLFVVVGGLLPFYPVSPKALEFRLGYHLLFLQDYLPANIVVAFWSLGVEEKFYLLAPFLWLACMRLKGLKNQILVLGLLSLLPAVFRTLVAFHETFPIPYEHYFRVYRSPFHMSVEGLLLGSVCALVYQHRQQLVWWQHVRVQPTLLFVGSVTIAVLLCGMLLLKDITPLWIIVGPLVIALAFSGLLLGCCMGRSFWTQWLTHKAFFFFSKISYSLYLVHMLFMEVGWRAVFWLFPTSQQLPLGLQFLVYFPVYIALSVSAALLLHYVVEKPFLLLKDRF
jgi:peptidoglycan/LPS O-acetylase OafA/YrhL